MLSLSSPLLSLHHCSPERGRPIKWVQVTTTPRERERERGKDKKACRNNKSFGSTRKRANERHANELQLVLTPILSSLFIFFIFSRNTKAFSFSLFVDAAVVVLLPTIGCASLACACVCMCPYGTVHDHPAKKYFALLIAVFLQLHHVFTKTTFSFFLLLVFELLFLLT